MFFKEVCAFQDLSWWGIEAFVEDDDKYFYALSDDASRIETHPLEISTIAHVDCRGFIRSRQMHRK